MGSLSFYSIKITINPPGKNIQKKKLFFMAEKFFYLVSVIISFPSFTFTHIIKFILSFHHSRITNRQLPSLPFFSILFLSRSTYKIFSSGLFSFRSQKKEL